MSLPLPRLLTAGPATSTVTMGVVYKSIGSIGFIVYFTTIVVGSLLFGLMLDWVFQFMQLDLSNHLTITESDHMFDTISSLFLSGLLVYYLIVMPFKNQFNRPKTPSCCSNCTGNLSKNLQK
jgi:hypothetical protein